MYLQTKISELNMQFKPSSYRETRKMQETKTQNTVVGNHYQILSVVTGNKNPEEGRLLLIICGYVFQHFTA